MRTIWIKSFYFAIALAISFVLGVIGYTLIVDMPFSNSFFETAMIISGMGPTFIPQDNHGKLFVAIFSLFAGLILVALLVTMINEIIEERLPSPLETKVEQNQALLLKSSSKSSSLDTNRERT